MCKASKKTNTISSVIIWLSHEKMSCFFYSVSTRTEIRIQNVDSTFYRTLRQLSNAKASSYSLSYFYFAKPHLQYCIARQSVGVSLWKGVLIRKLVLQKRAIKTKIGSLWLGLLSLWKIGNASTICGTFNVLKENRWHRTNE